MDSRRRYFGRLGVVLVVAQLALFVSAQECLLAAEGRELYENISPPLGPPLPSGTQAIVNSYKFGCCGNITAWQTYVQPGGGSHQGAYDITFQVWRPSPAVQEDGCYSMVGENRFTSISLGAGGLVSETPEPSNILTVQPEDVVGYYTVSNFGPQDNSGEGIQLNSSQRIDSVWYHTETSSQPLKFVAQNCPFPVGTESGRSLTSFTNAAPVLSVNVSSFPCQPKLTTLPSSSSSVPPSMLATATSLPPAPFLALPPSHTSTTSSSSSIPPSMMATTTPLPSASPVSSPISSPAPTTTSAHLSTAVIASLAAVGGSALLLTLLCTLVLAITLTKSQHKRQRTLAETSSIASDQKVSTNFLKMQENDSYTPTSHLIDECCSTINTESNLAYDTVRMHGNEAYTPTSDIVGEYSCRESHIYETVNMM